LGFKASLREKTLVSEDANRAMRGPILTNHGNGFSVPILKAAFGYD
jgi:hypothetical protein